MHAPDPPGRTFTQFLSTAEASSEADENTTPGESSSLMDLSRWISWTPFVTPGVLPTWGVGWGGVGVGLHARMRGVGWGGGGVASTHEGSGVGVHALVSNERVTFRSRGLELRHRERDCRQAGAAGVSLWTACRAPLAAPHHSSQDRVQRWA